MSEVIDCKEYIIEPGTNYEDVLGFFDTVHWSVHRMSGVLKFVELSNKTGECFVVHLKDNVPYIKRLKTIGED